MLTQGCAQYVEIAFSVACDGISQKGDPQASQMFKFLPRCAREQLLRVLTVVIIKSGLHRLQLSVGYCVYGTEPMKVHIVNANWYG